MATPIIEVSGLSKMYRLGQIGSSTFKDELERVWARVKAPRKAIENTDHKSDFWALRDVSFNVEPGQVIGVIGKNGAGKSTLLKILSRITEPTTGRAIMRGRIASLLEVGTGFHPDLTGRENVFLNGAILGMTIKEIRSKFDEIVAFSEIGKFIDTPVKRYSSGMYVRLAFAVAAHLEPEILILDEVLAVGDQQFQKKCLGKIQDISSNQGRTILFVSHHMAAIRRLCQKCIIMKQGTASPLLDMETAVDLYNGTGVDAVYDLPLADRPRLWGTEGRVCRVTRVRAVPAAPPAFGKPLDVDIFVTSTVAISEGMVGVSFNTIEGSRVLTLDSDTGGKYISLEKGENVIRLHLDYLPLHPAHYQIYLSVADGGHFLDIVEVGTWEVATSAEDLWSDRGFGACRLEPQVSVAAE